jgi:O-antigen/teichoic acid export membrane protein
MRKTTLRPLVSNSMKAEKLDKQVLQGQNRRVRNNTDSKGLQQALTSGTQQIRAEEPEVALPQSEEEARLLLRRTPGSYLLNQGYGLWVYLSLFLITVVLTRKLSVAEYGVYAVAMAAFNTIAYIVAFGLEDATTTFVPRVFAEYGRASAAALMRRLLFVRVSILTLSLIIMLFALPVLAALIALIPIQGSLAVAQGLRDPEQLGHIAPIAVYILGNGIIGLYTAICASLMRMRFVFALGSATQLFILVLSFVVLQLGWGTDGILWLFAVSSLVSALVFMLWLAPVIFARGASYIQPLRPVLQLGLSSWLTNLVSGALLKQVSIILLGLFAVSIIQIGYFNLSFQLAHAASLLLVSGFGGVGSAALAAAFVGKNYDRLSHTWQTLIKFETLLAAPILVFCLFNAQIVVHALYGSRYDPVGPLLTIFLLFNILTRVLGSTMNPYAMYVIGKARLVVLSQWLGLVAVTIIGIALIPHWGPAGALVADGLAQILMGGMLLILLWRVLPRKYPLNFTWRFLLGLTLAAMPGVLWHPQSRLLLVVSGVIFLVLCIGLLILIKPLDADDLEMVRSLDNRLVDRIAPLLKRFARA